MKTTWDMVKALAANLVARSRAWWLRPEPQGFVSGRWMAVHRGVESVAERRRIADDY